MYVRDGKGSTETLGGGRAPRRRRGPLAAALLVVLMLCCLLAATASAGAAVKPAKPTAKAPKGTITSAQPTFKWTKAHRAAKYELRVYKGKQLLLKKTGLKRTTWNSRRALPTDVDLTWKVHARNARGAGPWSRSRRFRVVPPGPSPNDLAIGDAYGGGIVAYIDGSGQHGLIAATADQTGAGATSEAGIQWATEPNWCISVPGALGTGIGTGSANTDAIIVQNGAGTDYAAGLARAYNGGGYSDWFLPSTDELNQLYLNCDAIGGFHTAEDDWPFYWSSSQLAAVADSAWVQLFICGYQSYAPKWVADRVRAVRAF